MTFQKNEGSKSVNLTEGKVTEVKIEVNAEDGTIKYYVVSVRRLSSKDAALSDIKLSVGTLNPEFSPDCMEYTGLYFMHNLPRAFR